MVSRGNRSAAKGCRVELETELPEGRVPQDDAGHTGADWREGFRAAAEGCIGIDERDIHVAVLVPIVQLHAEAVMVMADNDAAHGRASSKPVIFRPDGQGVVVVHVPRFAHLGESATLHWSERARAASKSGRDPGHDLVLETRKVAVDASLHLRPDDGRPRCRTIDTTPTPDNSDD